MPAPTPPRPHEPLPIRPALLPGVWPLIRDDSTLQIGVEPPHALVLRGATAAYAHLLRAIDGRHEFAALIEVAAGVGVGPAELDDLLELLRHHGLLVSFAPDASAPPTDADVAARLSPDLTAVALRRTGSARDAWTAARATMSRRGRIWVEVYGAGRVGSGVATLIAAAGVGRVSVVDSARCGPGDVSPLGLALDAIGASRQVALRRRVAAVSTADFGSDPSPSRSPDLCVLAPEAGPSASLATAWSRRDEPHLLAYVRETVGVVGPLVLPGRTACLRCLDLHRRDVDPAWPRVAAQLGDGLARRACDVSLATFVAAQCVLQALAFVDGDDTRAMSATLETRDGASVRRRVWLPHVACGCTWSAREQPPAAMGRRRTDPTTSATMAR